MKYFAVIALLAIFSAPALQQAIVETDCSSAKGAIGIYYGMDIECGRCQKVQFSTGSGGTGTCTQCDFLAPNDQSFSSDGLKKANGNLGSFGCSWTNIKFFTKNWWLTLILVVCLAACVGACVFSCLKRGSGEGYFSK